MFPEGRALEFLVVLVVMLVVVGPKDMPMLLRKFGQFMAKVRGMAAEFRASFDEMARQSELDDLRKEVEAMRKGQLADIAASTSSEANAAIADINQGLSDVGVQLHPPMSYQYAAETAAEPVIEAAPAAAPAKPPRARKAATPKAKAAAKPASKATTPAKAAKSAPAKAAAKPKAVKSDAPAKPRARKTVGSGS
jgi:sec-independent protein translocase protein TatB